MTNIIRTASEAKGGVTDSELSELSDHAEKWVNIAMQTGEVDKAALTNAINGLYRASDMRKPRVVIVPSPLVLAFAYGASAAIWYCKNNAISYGASPQALTERATAEGTYAATDEAYEATDEATRKVTYKAIYETTDEATYAATGAATDEATNAAIRRATERETYAATDQQTRTEINEAIYTVIHKATHPATDKATFEATLEVTERSALAATDQTTAEATEEATATATEKEIQAATDRETRAAIDDATRTASHAATQKTTDAATFAATLKATEKATDEATFDATLETTVQTTFDATLEATGQAIYEATDAATYAATDVATRKAIYKETVVATYQATVAATDEATYKATLEAAKKATDEVTYGATHAAMLDATRTATDAASSAALACHALAGEFGLQCALRWWSCYQGGNMWAGYASYISAYRDILGLKLPSHEAYEHWEKAAIHGGYRAMHDEFCLVSEFPLFVKTDSQHQPHCDDGPSHQWRDGWSLYHWHGKRVPDHWIAQRESLTASEVMKEEDVELRAVGCDIVGWDKVASELDRNIIDGQPDTDMGALVELSLPGLEKPGRFLMAICPRNGQIVEGVPYISDIDQSSIDTALAAQAWRDGTTVENYKHPESRT